MGEIIHWGQPPVLVLVQRCASVGRALARYLNDHYSDVVVAESPESAERLLNDLRGVPAHLVCGQRFGPDVPLGQDLVGSWRRRFPEITRAVLATGAEQLPLKIEGVDAIFEKPAHPSILIHLLGLRDKSTLLAGSFSPSTQTKEHKMKENKTPKAHSVNSLKERLAQAPKTDKQADSLRSAQGFASA